MVGGVYCAECKGDSEPGALYCTTCGRPLRRFSGPRGVEWGPRTLAPRRRRRWPWIVAALGAAITVLIIIAVSAAVIANVNRTRIVSLGAPVEAGDWKLVVSSIRNPDQHVTDSLFGFTPKPAAGHHFIGATVAVTNNTRSVKNTPVGLFFAVRDPAGHQYTPTHFDGSFGLAGSVPLGGLDPGASVSGNISFEVPDGASNLTLYFAPDWPSSNRRIGVVVPK